MDESLAAAVTELERGIRRRAERAGWSLVESSALGRTGGAQGVDSLVSALPGAVEGATPGLGQLPPYRRAFEMPPASVGFLVCGLESANPDDSYAAALWWTGLVRLDLPPSKRSDLHLFLVAPPGSANDPEWQGRRSQIESDERFCRKFVWLRSEVPSETEVSAFLDRTFLSEPWTGKGADPTALDPLEALIGDGYQSALLSAGEARLWVKRLGAAELTGMPQLADDLVAILEGKP